MRFALISEPGIGAAPPGQGNNIDAEKNVWVRPTLVKRSSLDEGKLPGGATTEL